MTSFKIEIPSFSIACKSWGDEKKPLMIALHGWLDNANSFDRLAPYLSKDFYLIAPDLPGHGLSSHLPEGCYYHFADMTLSTTQILLRIAEGLTPKRDKIHLLGHSMGACLASLIGGIIPEKIASIGLVEALGPFSGAEDTACQQMRHFIKTLGEGVKAPKSYPSFETAAQIRAKSGHLALEFAELLCQRGVVEEAGLFYWRHDRKLLLPSPLRMTERQILSCLCAIQAKTCLILAKNGFPFNSEEFKPRAEAVKDLTLYTLAGGHHLHMEIPEEVARCLLEDIDI